MQSTINTENINFVDNFWPNFGQGTQIFRKYLRFVYSLFVNTTFAEGSAQNGTALSRYHQEGHFVKHWDLYLRPQF